MELMVCAAIILLFLTYLKEVVLRTTKKDLSNIKYTIKYKKEYVLSLEQKEALIGIILGVHRKI